jgi:hypothetical protein
MYYTIILYTNFRLDVGTGLKIWYCFVCCPFYFSIPWINVLLLQICFGLFLTISRCRRDRMLVGSTTTYAISAYNH